MTLHTFLRLLALVVPIWIGSAVSAQTDLDLSRVILADPSATQVSVTMERGVRSHRDLKTAHLRKIRRDMVDGKEVSSEDLQDLADAGDGVAALRLVKSWKENETVPTEDLARYYALAAKTGRVAGLVGLIGILEDLNPYTIHPERLREYENILFAYADAGNLAASEAIVRFHRSSKPFGPMPDRISALLAGDNEVVALYTARDTMIAGWDDPDRLKQARGLLDIVSGSDSASIRMFGTTMAERLDVRINTLSEKY